MQTSGVMDVWTQADLSRKIFRVVAERLQTTWAHYLYLKQAATIAGRAPPSSAPMVPTPGKKFMIIRQEVNQPQPGLFVNFDSLARSPGSDVISGDDIAGLTAPKAESKKRSSLLGKVLSFGSGSKGAKADDEFATARREMAEQRARASKASASASTSASPHSSDSDSACSSPVYDEQRYVFKFFLAWQQNPMANRERILSRPRLPAPTQAVVSLEPGKDGSGSSSASDDDEQDDEDDIDALAEAAAAETEPIRPTGIAAGNAAYTGRAIAEWTQVVWECNSFVDRRCDEGCASLADVEVPILGVETFRKLGS